MPNSDNDIRERLAPLPAPNLNPTPIIAPLAPSQDTITDQLGSFYRPSSIPFIRHAPLPPSGQSLAGAASKSISQTAAAKIVYGDSTNINQVPQSTIRGAANATVIQQSALATGAAVSQAGDLLFKNIVNITGTTLSPTLSSFALTGVPDLTAMIVTRGNPVLLSAYVCIQFPLTAGSIAFAFFRDGVQLNLAVQQTYYAGNGGVQVDTTPSLSFIDFPNAGSHTYSLAYAVTTNSCVCFNENRAIQVIELG
jgi:hypothetical protein